MSTGASYSSPSTSAGAVLTQLSAKSEYSHLSSPRVPLNQQQQQLSSSYSNSQREALKRERQLDDDEDNCVVVIDDDEVDHSPKLEQPSHSPRRGRRGFTLAPPPPHLREFETKAEPTQSSPSSSPQEQRKDPLDDLSEEQLCAYTTVVHKGRSVFITGGAGTGKSFLLRTIIAALPRDTTFVTASTGLAALNLGGSTLHRFAGCGIINPGDRKDIVLSKVRKNSRSLRNWTRCKILVIDEISMIEPCFLDVVDYLGRHTRQRYDEPFGGIQLVLAGDFLQLPPVMKNRDKNAREKVFCFQSDAWMRANPQVCLLSRPFRQKKTDFYNMLNEIRIAELSVETEALLRHMSFTNSVNFVKAVENEEVDDSMLVVPTQNGGRTDNEQRLIFANAIGEAVQREFDGRTILRAMNREVDMENRRFFDRLTTDIYDYTAYEAKTKNDSLNKTSVQPFVQLRKGCRVMLIKNIDVCSGLVNGSTGVVKDFVTFGQDYNFKSSSAFEAGKVCGTHRQLPIVEFEMRAPDGSTSLTQIVVEPQEWKEMQGDTCVYSVVQIPLVLGYAITMHKSQGMTLTKVDIDMSSSFERGQVYVALSRCTDIANLQLHGFSADKVVAHRDAVAYYMALEKFDADHQWRQEWGAAAQSTEDFSSKSLPPRCFTPFGYNIKRAGRPTPKEEWAHNPFEDEDYEYDGEERVRSEHPGLPPCETSVREACRRDVLMLDDQAIVVKDMLRRAVVSADQVRDTRLVMDVSSMYHLVVAEDSVDKYNRIFQQGGNMMRVPAVVLDFLVRAATYVRETGASTASSPSPSPSEAVDEDVLEGSHVAAEALALIDKAKAEFVLDFQKEKEFRLLPKPQEIWQPFWRLLPLLQTEPCDSYSSTRWAPHFLNRHLDESDSDHEQLLQYAVFLRESFGDNMAICTDSAKLAAYALAFDFPVVSVSHLLRPR